LFSLWLRSASGRAGDQGRVIVNGGVAYL